MPDLMRILAVIHGPLVRAELFADVVAEEGHELLEWDIRKQGAPPEGFDAVLVFGGDQNVGEEVEHPWLNDEYDALRRWVEHGTPLFAVCLGAQTLAHALGATVHHLPAELAGFFDTELTATGQADPVLGVLPQRFRAFNGNGYSFDVPANGTLLAQGPIPQAFRVDGAPAWAVQFHPEVRHDQVLHWWTDEQLPRPRAELVAELKAELDGWQEHGRRLCRAFLATV
jgi:GMP synthase-like glutamine amidotransferase